MMFGFFKKKTECSHKNVLHGHDLDEWHYLGYVCLKLDDVEHYAFQFCRKDDTSKRSYVITGRNASVVKQLHSYVHRYLDPWTVGENEIYSFVYDGQSRWMNDFMIRNFGCVWDSTRKWWVSNESARHKAAVMKQKEKEKKKLHLVKDEDSDDSSTESNVVVGDFGRKG